MARLSWQNYRTDEPVPMAKNNHLQKVNNLYYTLNDQLLRQSFSDEADPVLFLQQCQSIARMYAMMENAISVLSDMSSNKSHIYHKGLAPDIGLPSLLDGMEIESIWEKDILDRIHPDDLLAKHALELQFFQMVKKMPAAERSDYHVVSLLRMRNSSELYIPVRHRMFYFSSTTNESIRLALCLYNLHYDHSGFESTEALIVHTKKGKIITPGKEDTDQLLSLREKQVLLLIREGKRSKEIAAALSISLNTVNRHRQNIFEKLNVNNSIEACKIAGKMGLI